MQMSSEASQESIHEKKWCKKSPSPFLRKVPLEEGLAFWCKEKRELQWVVHLFKSSMFPSCSLGSCRGGGERGDGAGPCSVPREPEGLQCHQQGKAMQQTGLQCRCVVNTHTQSKKQNRRCCKKLFIIINYVYVRTQCPFPCCLKKIFIAFIS